MSKVFGFEIFSDFKKVNVRIMFILKVVLQDEHTESTFYFITNTLPIVVVVVFFNHVISNIHQTLGEGLFVHLYISIHYMF